MATSANANPRLPADLGLPALGMIMQLQAGFAMAYGALVSFVLLASGGFGGGFHGGADHTVRLLMILMVILGMVRGAFHLGAARELVYRSPNALAAVKRYLIACGITGAGMIGTVLIITKGGLPAGALVALVAFLGFWPAALAALVFRGEVKRMFEAAETFDVALVPSDRSIEGAGVLMTVFGAMGLAYALYGFYMLASSLEGMEVASVLLMIFVATLIVRSTIHLTQGVRASKGMTPKEFRRRIGWYMGAAIASVGVMALAMIVMSKGRGLFLVIVGVGIVTAMLLVWPIVLRNFSQSALMADFGDDDTTIAFGVAPDRGLTAFGYLLVLFGAFELTTALVSLVGMDMLNEMDFLAVLAEDAGLAPVIIHIVVGGVTLWAGMAFRGMHAHYRTAAYVFAGTYLSGAILNWILVDFPDADFGLDFKTPTMIVGVAVSIVLPLMALVLAQRKLPAPEPRS